MNRRPPLRPSWPWFKNGVSSPCLSNQLVQTLQALPTSSLSFLLLHLSRACFSHSSLICARAHFPPGPPLGTRRDPARLLCYTQHKFVLLHMVQGASDDAWTTGCRSRKDTSL
ncbi:hypothetical protein GALMADRAFT_1175423 [Galerina marginata CBS 339.88]|uniref:Uncharacterized protein n=1 Tax=Galerina marginata (strain CBS 339.88) TaxID=685588 RepID=A0A067TA08_GALM3|nr:hypothetical protein GALMADRAFT_1175423 [Galerina marginata CBS 339.88]